MRNGPTGRLTRAAAVLLLAGLTCALQGCWWGYTTASQFPEHIKTVYVQAFDNETFWRGLEVQLTRAVVDEISLRNPMTFAKRDDADSILRGTLLSVRRSTHVRTARDEVVLQRVTISVRVQWHDARAGTDLLPPTVVRETVKVPVTTDEDLFAVVARETAQAIVDHMLEPW
jgi:hypothetical protein